MSMKEWRRRPDEQAHPLRTLTSADLATPMMIAGIIR
jgi:hypothetical protein